MFSDDEQTMSLSSLFHVLMTLLLKIYKVEVKCPCVYIQSFYLLTQEFFKPCKPVDIVETPLSYSISIFPSPFLDTLLPGTGHA